MDNLTHSLFGLTLARTPLGRAGRGATATLLVASNVPDIDVVAASRGALRYLEWHRGPTHGLVGIVGLGLLTAFVVWIVVRVGTNSTRPRASFPALWGLAMCGVVCHVMMDLVTSYGTRPLSPFDWTWFAEDWMPIVDIYLLAILSAGLWLGRSARGRWAAIALALMAANYGIRAAAHHHALAGAPQALGIATAERCDDAVAAGSLIDRWPRPQARSARDRSSTRCLVEIAAIPDFVSPFRWRLIADLSNAYETRTVNLLDGADRAEDARSRAIRFSSQWTPAVMKAAASPVGRAFLDFSRFPATSSVVEVDGTTTVRWSDLRFNAGAPLGRQRNSLFNAVVHLDSDGRIFEERLGQ